MAEKKPTPPTQPSFVGERIYLRPATVEDIANTHHWFIMSEPQYQSCRPLSLLTPAEASEAFKKQERSADQGKFMIVRIADNMPVGRVTFFNWNTLNRSVELGLLIDPDERRKGHGSEALKVMIRYLFKYRGLNKVYGQTSALNTSTVKLLEKLGFKRDGTLRRHYFINGEFVDGYVYSKLAFEGD